MALGQIFTIANGTARLVVAQSHTEVPSVGVLNPNDGVAYLKLNGPAGPSPPEWDWKLPSQSYGYFPGPWTSLGIYFSDQSGSNRSGDINVYESQQQFADIPQIAAIGRAVAAVGTTVDIGQGGQPQNPPSGAGRLWIDGTGNLHILQSNGTDKTVLDSSTQFGGDVYQTYSALRVQRLSGNASSVVSLPTGVSIQAGSGATIADYGVAGSPAAPLIGISGLTVTPNPFYCNVAQVNSTLVVNGTSTMQNINMQTGNLNISAGSIVANSPGNITIQGAMNSTQIYITGSPPYLFFPDGSNYLISSSGYLYVRFPSGLIVQNAAGAPNNIECAGITMHAGLTFAYSPAVITTSTGNLYLRSQTGLISMDSGPLSVAGVIASAGDINAGGKFGTPNYICAPTVYLNANTAGGPLIQAAATAIRYSTPGGAVHSFESQSGGYAPINASAFNVSSAKKFKKSINWIEDPISIVLEPTLHGISYTDVNTEEARIGFIADDWYPIVPEVVFLKDGEPEAMGYSDVTAILFEALKRYIQGTNARLDKLESQYANTN